MCKEIFKEMHDDVCVYCGESFIDGCKCCESCACPDGNEYKDGVWCEDCYKEITA